MSKKMNKERLSTKDVMQLFDTSYMTVYNWRMGRGGRLPLPFHNSARGTRNGVYFKYEEVLRWALEAKVRIKNPATKELVYPKVKRVQLLEAA